MQMTWRLAGVGGGGGRGWQQSWCTASGGWSERMVMKPLLRDGSICRRRTGCFPLPASFQHELSRPNPPPPPLLMKSMLIKTYQTLTFSAWAAAANAAYLLWKNSPQLFHCTCKMKVDTGWGVRSCISVLSRNKVLEVEIQKKNTDDSFPDRSTFFSAFT